ncbi:nickel/cobalt transporter [Rhizobiaceae bacterium BDR2-2]|uniref:Nickel/cobalt efflux system n=1 Tax=Ectorhizobium quercum TaxID=2965071 RepID=A0AAE3MX46_9HYPH|nr:nickel/cobalt transporter [Ectorhizobium quercum]MCX8996873.1 nickel/cobalt transporter [Ectorhizobium quercum]
MLRAGRTAALAALVLVFGAGLAAAQSSLGIGAAEPSFRTNGLFGPFLAFVNREQQGFYRALTGALSAMRQDPWQLWSLAGLSFAYGIFHAAGPGHGKAVISSYMIANETQLRRGVAISFLSAMMQGLMAIVLVGVAYLVLRGTSVSLTMATQAMERASFALVALFGLWLLYGKVRSLNLRPAATDSLFDGTMARGNRTGLDFRAEPCGGRARPGPDGICADCGMTHMPDPAMLKSERFSIREAWSAILAVGLRPCSGAILVVSFSLLNGLYLGGILSVLAISLGTAITVSILASLAVGAKDVALRFTRPGSKTAGRLRAAIEIGGALFIVFVGVTLLAASLQS